MGRVNIKNAFAELAVGAVPRSELRLLLADVLGRDIAWLIANDDYALSDHEESRLRTAVARRSAGEPIAYILGYREFYGRRFRCTPSALIPRPETELIVETVLSDTNGHLAAAKKRGPNSTASKPLRVLDVGTGTGCIAITLALEFISIGVHAEVIACDLSRDALALAQMNSRALHTNVSFIESDWFSAVNANEQFDLIVSNPPYIVPNDPHLFQGDVRFEPWLALQDRFDGLQSYRELAHGAKRHLRDGGLLIVEHGYDQGDSVPALFREAGFVEVEMIRDLAGQARVTRAHLSHL